MARTYRGYHISKPGNKDYFLIQKFVVEQGGIVTIGSAPTWDDCLIFIDREIERIKQNERSEGKNG